MKSEDVPIMPPDEPTIARATVQQRQKEQLAGEQHANGIDWLVSNTLNTADDNTQSSSI